MDKKEFLYFEEDDTSKVGVNGKQVFVAKRINGKVTRNKEENEDGNKNNLNNIKSIPEEEIIIGINNSPYKKKNINKSSNSKPKKKKQNIQKNKKQPKKKKNKATKLLKIILLLIIIAGTIAYAFVSPIFNIQSVVVDGNEKVNASTIISLSGLRVGENIFRTSKKDIQEKIKENSYIEEIKVKRELPGTIHISIKERNVDYQIQVMGSYVYIDYKGNILENSKEKKNVPIIQGFFTSQEDLLKLDKLDNQDIMYLNSILKIMESAKNLDMHNLITKIQIEDDEYILELEKEKKVVYIGDETNINNKMLYMQTIINSKKDVAGKIFLNGDLNKGFKPYFRKD